MVGTLAGLVGVPGLLLWQGQRFRSFSQSGLGAYRGAVVGYGLAAAAMIVTLLVPPYAWPPTPGLERMLLGVGLLAGPGLGAVVGAWRGRARGRDAG